jgi:hypothetical protein
MPLVVVAIVFTVFTDRYLLASTELNVLNVILSQER